MGWNGPINSKISWYELASNVFATNAPDPPHWTLNSTFVMFRSVWVHLGPFGCDTNRGAKRTELVQKFENDVASEFFAPNAPDPPHWTLNWCFGAFRTIWVHLWAFDALRNSVQNGLNQCKSSCHEVASEFFATNAPDPPHWIVNWCFGAFHTIWVHSGPFVCLTKLGAIGPN